MTSSDTTSRIRTLSPALPRGAFTCDFAMPPGIPPELIPLTIERDRHHMAAQPGFVSKHIPLAVDANGAMHAGGRYLFETRQQARAYHQWLKDGFIIDGVAFLSRPELLDAEAYDWDVLGVATWSDRVSSVVRTERFRSSQTRSELETLWPLLCAAAERANLASLELLWNEESGLLSLVSYAPALGTPDPSGPDMSSLRALAGAPSLGRLLEEQHAERLFDRTSWVLTVWYPLEASDSGRRPVWPNSPPFPAPPGAAEEATARLATTG